MNHSIHHISSSPNYFTIRLHTVSTSLFISLINHLTSFTRHKPALQLTLHHFMSYSVLTYRYYHFLFTYQFISLHLLIFPFFPSFIPVQLFIKLFDVTRPIITFTFNSFVTACFCFFSFIYSIWTFPQHSEQETIVFIRLGQYFTEYSTTEYSIAHCAVRLCVRN